MATKKATSKTRAAKKTGSARTSPTEKTAAARKPSAARKTAASAKSPAKKKRSAATKPVARKPPAKKKNAKAKRTARTSPARAPKVSALEGASVDDWAKKLNGWQADALRIIRALVTRHAPGATLVMKWGQPVWEHNGPFAWLRPATKHVSFGFWRGAELIDPEGHLEGDGDRMRHLKMTSAEDIDAPRIEGFVKQAIALNGSKGDPTKRN